MALNIDDELNLPLSEFVKLPTTVAVSYTHLTLPTNSRV